MSFRSGEDTEAAAFHGSFSAQKATAVILDTQTYHTLLQV